MKSEQLDFFLDILPAKRKRGRPRKKPAEVVIFPLERDQRAVRQMAETMTRIPASERNRFWERHSRNLIEERVDAGLPRHTARAAVIKYTAAVRRLTRYLDSDPTARLSGGGA